MINKIKQTAVEHFLNAIKDQIPLSKEHLEMIESYAKKAKEMEKVEHGITWDKAIDAHEKRGHNLSRSICDFDDYYNETYGGNK
jgi:hypothetical protein